MNNLEYIESCFEGSVLKEEERAGFEKKLIEDPLFADELAFYLSLDKATEVKVTEGAKARFRELYKQNPPTRAVVQPMKTTWLYAAASVIIFIVIGAYFFLRPPIENRLANRYIDDNLTNVSVVLSNMHDSMQQALRLYNDGKLEAAASQFENLVRADTSAFMAKNYAGITYLRLNNYDRALFYFKQLETYASLRANPAKFYQALTLLKRNKSGDAIEARKLLQQVVSKNLEGKQTAIEWLRKL